MASASARQLRQAVSTKRTASGLPGNNKYIMPSKTFDAGRNAAGSKVRRILLADPVSMRLAPFVVQLFMETEWNSSLPPGCPRSSPLS
jgi:hypothetical protein